MNLLSTSVVVGILASLCSGEKVRGVNMGGWLVLEPWINPSLFKQFNRMSDPAVDEFTFCKKLGKDEARRQLEKHWRSWVTPRDFRLLKKAGITHVRFPVGYWAIDTNADEPWVQGALHHLRNGVRWAKKYNIKAVLDIHGAPGSQNGFDNSGQAGPINFMNSQRNVDRMLNVVSNLTLEFSVPEFSNTIDAIQLVNEPAGWAMDFNKLRKFYYDGYNRVRKINPKVSVMVHDAFLGPNRWKEMAHLANFKMDTHIYQVFDSNLVTMSKDQHLSLPCSRWGELKSSAKMYPTVVGEFSLATTDCTKWLNGFLKGSRFENTFENHQSPRMPGDDDKKYRPKCAQRDDITTYTADHRAFLKKFSNQQFRVYETAGNGWYFWNFKAEKSPEWDFLQGVREGWIDLHSIHKSTCEDDH